MGPQWTAALSQDTSAVASAVASSVASAIASAFASAQLTHNFFDALYYVYVYQSGGV